MIGTESAVQGQTGTAAVMTTDAPQTTTETTTEAEAPAETVEASEAPEPSGKKLFGKVGKTKEAPVVEAPKYSANYKFKVLDKEHEIDEFIRPIIKDADTEKKIKELYEKAYGLDSVKSDRQTLKTELAEYKEKMSQTDAALETLGQYVRQKDFDSFFEGLNIPKQDILQYALQLVQREQMSPEQKAQWEASRQAQQQARYYEVQNQQLMQSQQQFAVQQRTWELQQAIGTPEVKVFADAYNQGMGNPEAFNDYVIQIGQAYAARGHDIPAQQAVQEAIKHLRAINPSLGQSQTATQVVQPSSKPVIPNIQGRGTSAVKSTVKSLDDLRKKAKEITTQENIF
jgi:hypothetical protein